MKALRRPSAVCSASRVEQLTEIRPWTSRANFGSSNTATTGIGGENPNIDATANGDNDPLVTGLRARGHTVSVSAQSSGVSTIVRVTEGSATRLGGGADPRREGIVLGDPVVP